MSSVYLPKKRISDRRVSVVLSLVFFALLAVLSAGYVRLTLQHERLSALFLDTHSGSQVLHGHRGNIWVRDGGSGNEAVAVAMNTDVYNVYLSPRVFREARQNRNRGGNSSDKSGKGGVYEERAAQLAQLLEMEEEIILKKMYSRRGFEYLKKQVSARVKEKVDALNIVGVKTEYVSRRFYPDNMMSAHVIGYTDAQGVGQLGVERAEHARLSATDGRWDYTVPGDNALGLEHEPEEHGRDVYLTLDRRLQYVAFRALEQAVHKHRASSAAAFMMDVTSGEVLALANYPSFNPHVFRQRDIPNQVNHALADRIEPASTVKPFVVAQALERRLTRLDEVFPTKKPLRRGKLRVFDKHVRDDLTPGGIVMKSSNVGAVLLAERIGAKKLEATYRALGIGGAPLLDFPGEATGKLQSYEDWRRSDFATHAYGYGLALTLPQLVRAYSVFATDGTLVTPYLWRDKSPAAASAAAANARVFSPRTAYTVRQMLESVVSREGTASGAIIPGYRIAGKTGTAGKWTNGEFDLDRRRVFFVGLAPASRPRYILAVMVDEPTRNGDSGGAVAAPVFRQIMQQALLFGGIEPDAVEALEVLEVPEVIEVAKEEQV